MTKGYEKLLASCQTLSELLHLPLPTLKTASQKTDSIQIGSNTGSSVLGGDSDLVTGGKWEDEEERRFFEEVPDLKDYVPRSVLGVEDETDENTEDDMKEKEKREQERVQEEVRKLEEELAGLKVDGEGVVNGLKNGNGKAFTEGHDSETEENEDK